MSFAIDLAVLAVLVGTLGYAWMVDRRVRRLMDALRDVEPMIGNFSEAVERSESTVSALRAARDNAQPLRRAEAEAPAQPAAKPEPSFRSNRDRAAAAAEATPIAGKSELIRGFFDTVRQREA
ncbi:flagellar motor switch protein [Marinovum sp. KMM 9879]